VQHHLLVSVVVGVDSSHNNRPRRLSVVTVL